MKLGTLSSPLEKQLTNTLLEKLNVLTLNIFNVRNEEDVLRIISDKNKQFEIDAISNCFLI